MIDARAIISPKAQLAADVTVGPFSIIGPDVQIGAGTIVGPHVVINGPTVIGADNHIFQFASIGDAPQDKKYKGEPTRLEIGDRNEAIRRAVADLGRGDVLLIAGKGHETGQIVGQKTVPFSDHEAVARALMGEPHEAGA